MPESQYLIIYIDPPHPDTIVKSATFVRVERSQEGGMTVYLDIEFTDKLTIEGEVVNDEEDIDRTHISITEGSY